MTITITNADKSLLSMLKAINEKLTTPYEIVKEKEKKPSKRLLKAIKEVEEMQKNPHLYKSYSSIEEFKQALES